MNVISNRRKELGLTMKALAEKVGVSEATVSRWESGNIASLKQTKIALLSKALNISPAELVASDTDSSYYHDPETAELAERLKNQPGMRMLFDAAKDVSPEDLEMVAAMVRKFKK